MSDQQQMDPFRPIPVAYGTPWQRSNQHPYLSDQYTQPYQANMAQQIGMFGSNFVGQQRYDTALPQAMPGRTIAAGVVAARRTSEQYGLLEREYGRRTGEAYGSALGNAGRQLGLDGWAQSQQSYDRKAKELGTSVIGQQLSGMLDQSSFMNGVRGGDRLGLDRSLFDQRNMLAFNNKDMFNPNNTQHAGMASNYSMDVISRINDRLQTNDDGVRSPLVNNTSITGGRDVSVVSDVAAMILQQDPNSRGLSQGARDAYAASNDRLKSLQAKDPNDLTAQEKQILENGGRTEDDSKAIAKDVNQFGDRVIETTRALADLGDAIGEVDLKEVAGRLNKSLQGMAMKMTPAQLQQQVDTLRATEIVYGVSIDQQMNMRSGFGDSFAQRSGGIDPFTGENTSPMSMLAGEQMTRETLDFAKKTGMDPEKATIYMRNNLDKAMSSSAGRLSVMAEAKYRAGDISESTYRDYQEAQKTGDAYKRNEIIERMNKETGGDIMAEGNSEAGMRIASETLRNLDEDSRAAATSAILERAIEAPKAEMDMKTNRIAQQKVRRMSTDLLGDIGAPQLGAKASTKSTVKGYKLALESQIAAAGDDKELKQSYQNKLDLLNSTEKSGGDSGVMQLVNNSDLFAADKATMNRFGEHQATQERVDAARSALGSMGMSGKWLDEARNIVGDNPALKERMAKARQLMQKDPAAAAAEMDSIYAAMTPEQQKNIRSAEQVRKAGGLLTDKAFNTEVNAEYEARKAKDGAVNVSRDDVMTEMAAKRGVTFTKNDMSANAQLNNMEELNRASQLQTMISSKEGRKEIDTLMATGGADGKGVSYQEAVTQMAEKNGFGGTDSTSLKKLTTQLAMEAGYAPDVLGEGVDDQTAATNRDAVKDSMLSTRGIERANSHLKMSVKQRIVEKLTNPKTKMSFADILGISNQERQELFAKGGATGDALSKLGGVSSEQFAGMDDAAIEKQFGGLGEDRVAQLKKVRDSINAVGSTKGMDPADAAKAISEKLDDSYGSLGTAALTKENVAKAAEADRYQSAFDKAAQGDESGLKELADEQAERMREKEGISGNWFGNWFAAEPYEDDALNVMREKAAQNQRSGQRLTIEDMPALEDATTKEIKARTVEQQQRDAEEAAGKKGGAGGSQRIILEGGNLTIDMDGKQLDGALLATGRSQGG